MDPHPALKRINPVLKVCAWQSSVQVSHMLPLATLTQHGHQQRLRDEDAWPK